MGERLPAMRNGSGEHPVLRPFFGYYGGKWRDTPRLYPPPEHNTIVEPFAGSAGYSLRFPRTPRVILYEKDPIVAGVWQYLIGVKPSGGERRRSETHSRHSSRSTRSATELKRLAALAL